MMDMHHVGNVVHDDGTIVRRPERKRNPRLVVSDFVSRSFRFAVDHMGGIKRVSDSVMRTQRAVRYWMAGEREAHAVDLLMAARKCKALRSRLVAFLHLPESRLDRMEAELTAIEAQADALVADAHTALARSYGEVGGVHRARLSTLASAARGLMRLRFRRHKAAAP